MHAQESIAGWIEVSIAMPETAFDHYSARPTPNEEPAKPTRALAIIVPTATVVGSSRAGRRTAMLGAAADRDAGENASLRFLSSGLSYKSVLPDKFSVWPGRASLRRSACRDINAA
jgi:hypothetical protein